MRHLLGRQRSGEQGPTPSWLPVPASLVPFVCGSVSGVMLHDTIHVCCIDHFVRLLHGLLFTPWMCRFSSATTSLIDCFEPIFSVKTKVQQRSLAGERYRGPLETLHRLIRGMNKLRRQIPHIKPMTGPDPSAPKPLLSGIARIYRGLGVSALRSITTHGLLWTLFDMTAQYIDNLPPSSRADY